MPFFQSYIKIGIIIDNAQKFNISSIIFCTLKNSVDKKFFVLDKKFDCCRCRRRLTLGPKKTVEAWFHNRVAGGIF